MSVMIVLNVIIAEIIVTIEEMIVTIEMITAITEKNVMIEEMTVILEKIHVPVIPEISTLRAERLKRNKIQDVITKRRIKKRRISLRMASEESLLRVQKLQSLKNLQRRRLK